MPAAVAAYVTTRKRGHEAMPPYSVMALPHYVIILGGLHHQKLIVIAAACCDRAAQQLIALMRGCAGVLHVPVRAQWCLKSLLLLLSISDSHRPVLDLKTGHLESGAVEGSGLPCG